MCVVCIEWMHAKVVKIVVINHTKIGVCVNFDINIVLSFFRAFLVNFGKKDTVL